MSSNTMVVSYDSSNAKSVKHPSNGDVWDEAIACVDILQSGAPVTAVSIMLNEIRWFEKYRGQDIYVSDSYLDTNLSVDDYIVDLESNLFTHEFIFDTQNDRSQECL